MLDTNITISELVNEDGTPMHDYPRNPLFDKYPPNKKYRDSENCIGYSCMNCDLCPRGSYWKVPEEDREVYNEYIKKCQEYDKIHNPKLYKLLVSRRNMT